MRILSLNPNKRHLVFGLYEVEGAHETVLFEHVVFLQAGSRIEDPRDSSVKGEISAAIRNAIARGPIDVLGCVIHEDISTALQLIVRCGLHPKSQPAYGHSVEAEAIEAATSALPGVPVIAIGESDLVNKPLSADQGLYVARKIYQATCADAERWRIPSASVLQAV